VRGPISTPPRSTDRARHAPADRPGPGRPDMRLDGAKPTRGVDTLAGAPGWAGLGASPPNLVMRPRTGAAAPRGALDRGRPRNLGGAGRGGAAAGAASQSGGPRHRARRAARRRTPPAPHAPAPRAPAAAQTQGRSRLRATRRWCAAPRRRCATRAPPGARQNSAAAQGCCPGARRGRRGRRRGRRRRRAARPPCPPPAGAPAWSCASARPSGRMTGTRAWRSRTMAAKRTMSATRTAARRTTARTTCTTRTAAVAR
jgi:hypothetical protein